MPFAEIADPDEKAVDLGEDVDGSNEDEEEAASSEDRDPKQGAVGKEGPAVIDPAGRIASEQPDEGSDQSLDHGPAVIGCGVRLQPAVELLNTVICTISGSLYLGELESQITEIGGLGNPLSHPIWQLPDQRDNHEQRYRDKEMPGSEFIDKR